MSSKKCAAVLIGCNYSNIPSARLSGCINDIVNIRNMLIDAYGYTSQNITMLRDDGFGGPTMMPTRANILNALNRVCSDTSLTELWIHYSGHGTQVADKNGDEADKMDEAIVPCDFTTTGFIVDDDLQTLFKKVAPTCRVFIAFDSCHSGTAIDLPFVTDVNTGTSQIATNNTWRNPNVCMLSGCRDAQTSADAYSDLEKVAVGAFTDAFCECLRAANHATDIVQLHKSICQTLTNKKFSQRPVLTSSSNAPLFRFHRLSSSPSTSLATPPSSTSLTVVALPPPPPPLPVKIPTSVPTSTLSSSVQAFSYKINPSTGKLEISPTIPYFHTIVATKK